MIFVFCSLYVMWIPELIKICSVSILSPFKEKNQWMNIVWSVVSLSDKFPFSNVSICNRVYTRGDRRRNCRSDRCSDDRLYCVHKATVAAIVAATVAPCIYYRPSSRRLIEQPTAIVTATIACSVYTGRSSQRLSWRRSPPTGCGDDRPM